jgi:toxin ParE1/3/4
MAYKIIISPRAQKEIENAIDFYALYSDNAPRNFITTLKNTYQILSQNPFSHRVRYKSVRALKLNKFPYSLYFDINQTQKRVKILSCFHNKRDPNKRPKG